MTPLLNADWSAWLCLAMMRRKTWTGRTFDAIEPHRLFWLMTGLVLLAAACGLALLILAMLTWGAPDLDDPPAALSGDRAVREGVGLALFGGLFLAIACGALQAGMTADGLFVLFVAALILAVWGGGRVLLAAGGTRRTAANFLKGAAAVLAVATGALFFQFQIADLL